VTNGAITILILLLLSQSTVIVHAKVWRGIVPLHSTRADVERLLGAPGNNDPNFSYYALPDELVVIIYETSRCSSNLGKLGYGWNVPLGTVTDIGMIPKNLTQAALFKMDRNLKKWGGPSQLFTLYSYGSGLTAQVYNGMVISLNYDSTKDDDFLRCPKVSQGVADFISPSAELIGASPAEEKATLDRVASDMKETLFRGIFKVYGPNPRERGLLRKKAELARKYLVQKFGIEAQRILIVEVGYAPFESIISELNPIAGDNSYMPLSRLPDPE
jgi:hypothetical protein